MQIESIVDALRRSDDLRSPKYQGHANFLTGHCYAASEALYHVLGGKKAGWTPCFIRHEGHPHWFISHQPDGMVIDVTAGQFASPVPYHEATRKGFLTRQPSKRARELLKRAGLTNTRRRGKV